MNATLNLTIAVYTMSGNKVYISDHLTQHRGFPDFSSQAGKIHQYSREIWEVENPERTCSCFRPWATPQTAR